MQLVESLKSVIPDTIGLAAYAGADAEVVEAGSDHRLPLQSVALCCKHIGLASLGGSAACISDHVPSPVVASSSSRRTRLWELPTDLHCAIIGVGSSNGL